MMHTYLWLTNNNCENTVSFIDWKGSGKRLQWSQALNNVSIGLFEDYFAVKHKMKFHLVYSCCLERKGLHFFFRVANILKWCFMTWRLYLHLDEHAQAAYFESLGGNNIVDRQREWEKERGREREPMQTTKECSPSLSAAALYPPVVGCVIAPQLKCLCLWLYGVHVCVCVWVCAAGEPWWPHSTMSTAQPISHKWVRKHQEDRLDKGRIPCFSLQLVILPLRSVREREEK